MNLELMAMRWLKWEKKCMIVLCERSPREWSCGRPDVLGVTRDRYATEIEIKRTLSDFKADFSKGSRERREHYLEKFPKQFYYLVPASIANSVNGMLPDWAGLMQTSDNEWSVEVVKGAPVNRSSKRYSIKECVHLACLMSNQVVAVETSYESMVANFRHGHQPYWYDLEGFTHYEI